jgi:DNA repair exonuclease SbcCD ATPase subunit
LYKEILGGGDAKFLVNIYTDSNQGYVNIYLTIDDKKYVIRRTVKTTKHKDGKVSNSYGIKYKSLEFEYDNEGNLDNEKWEDEKSDEATAEKKEVESLVDEAIGDFDDFTKVTLQVQGGKDDYISQAQQPKNALISRYLGLEAYRMRYEYANEYFKEIKKKQKEIGDKLNIELKITELERDKAEKDIMMSKLKIEKEEATKNKEDLEAKILDLTKKIEKLDTVQYSDASVVDGIILTEKGNLDKYIKAISDLEKWLSENFKKELPFKEGETLESVTSDLENQQNLFKSEKEEYVKIDNWIKENPKKELPLIDGIEDSITTIREEVVNLQNQLPTYRGKSCSTCGNVQTKADPEKEKECLEAINNKNTSIATKQLVLTSHKEISKANDNYDNQNSKLSVLVESLKNKKERIEVLKARVQLFSTMKEIIEHNQKVEDNTSRLNSGKNVKTQTEKKIETLEDNLIKIKSNADKQKKNKLTQEKIDESSELLKAYKLTFYNIEKNINTIYGDIRVLESDIKNYSEKLESIKEVEKMFKKYSVYLQAMHRDGIPALIIRKKLPIINSKVNSILQHVVNFKVELDISASGDITESFYYSPDKADALPLQFASGAQKFVASIAIKDALHFISQLTKPSMCIIDEGFGTLDTRLSFEIVNILQYLKNKHKNVIVITHKNEIKDFADNIIEVTKVKTGVPQLILDSNPEAGTTRISVS